MQKNEKNVQNNLHFLLFSLIIIDVWNAEMCKVVDTPG